jgi:hypothetical protein
LNLYEFNTLGDYDIELDESIFDINIPNGFTELTIIDILEMVPTEIKAGAAGAGLGFILIPVGFVSFRRRRRKKMLQMEE